MDRPPTKSLRKARRWLKWLRRDAQLFGAYREAAINGSGDRHRAYRAWRDNAAKSPGMPTDDALKWIRKYD